MSLLAHFVACVPSSQWITFLRLPEWWSGGRAGCVGVCEDVGILERVYWCVCNMSPLADYSL